MSVRKSIHLGAYLKIKPLFTTKKIPHTTATCETCGYIGGLGVLFCGMCGLRLPQAIDTSYRTAVSFTYPESLAVNEHQGYVYLFDSTNTPDVKHTHADVDLTNININDEIEKFRVQFKQAIDSIVPRVESVEVCYGLTAGWF